MIPRGDLCRALTCDGHCAKYFTCICLIFSKHLLEVYTIIIYISSLRNWSSVKLNSFLKVTCSTVSDVLRMKTRSNFNCIIEPYPVLWVFARHVRMLRSMIQLDAQQVFSVELYHPKGGENWFLEEGKRNLTF